MRKLIFLVIVSTSVFSVDITAQQKVSQGSFNLILKLMLRHHVKEITVSQAAMKKNALYLDAREKNEYDVSHLNNAIFVGYNSFDPARLSGVPKDREMIVYCSIGKLSEAITEKLNMAGFKNVYNLYGGIFEWVNQGNVVVDNQNNITNKVHAFGKVWGRWLTKEKKYMTNNFNTASNGNLIEQGMHLAATLPDILPENANEKIKPVYEEIQATLRIPFVNLIFRTLANYPEYLAQAWQLLKPVFGTRAFELLADEVRASALTGQEDFLTKMDWKH